MIIDDIKKAIDQIDLMDDMVKEALDFQDMKFRTGCLARVEDELYELGNKLKKMLEG